MSDWRSRATPVNANYGQPVALQGAEDNRDYLTQLTEPQPQQMASNTDWRSRAQPVQAQQPVAAQQPAVNTDWRSRAQVINPPSTTMDVAKTVGSNIAKGTVDAAMTLPNTLNEAFAGPQYLYEGLVGEDRKDFKPWKPFMSSEDVVSGSAIDYQPKTDAGKMAEIPTRLLTNLVAPTAINKGGNAALNSPTAKNLVNDTSGVAPPKPVLKTGEELKNMSSEAFKQADDLGASYKPQEVSIPFAKTIAEIKPRPIAGKTLTSEEQKLIQHLDEYAGIKGNNLTFDEVRRLDSGLSQKISANFIDAKTGQPDANGRKLMILQTKLRQTLDDIPENSANDALRNANKLWKAQIIMDDLDTIAERAAMSPNVAQALRTGYKNLYFDKDRVRGWPEPAMELLKKAATPGVTDEFLAPIASRITAAIMGGTGNIGGAATAHIIGATARGARATVAAKQGAKVQQSIVDDAINSQRPVKVPEKSNIPLMLSSPDKMSRLPMSDTEVNISRKLMEGGKPTGVDTSGGAIKPPVSQVGKLSTLTGKDKVAYDSLANMFKNGELSQNKFVQTAKEQFNLSETKARALAKEIKNYGAK